MVSPGVIVAGTLGILGVVGISMYPALKSAPFAYGCARVRAARGKLLSDSELQSFAQESYKDVIYNLEKRGFAELLALIDNDFREEHVQKAIKERYLENVQNMIRYVPTSFKPFFKVLASKEEAEFVISALRSKTSPFYGRHLFEELFVGTAHFSESELSDLKQMSLNDFMMRLKKTPYGELVMEFTDEIKNGNLQQVEKALTEEYFSKLKKAAKHNPSLHKYAKILIDLHNIRRASCFYQPVFVSGGSLTEENLTALGSVKDVKSIVSILESTQYHESLKDVEDVKSLTKATYKFQKDHANKLAIADPLSINQILSYYIHKTIELKNIQIILKLLSVRFEPRMITESII